MTEREARIQAESSKYIDSLPKRRAQEEYEPYYIYSERQHHHSEFNEDSMKDYMWNRWGIK